ncbi:MAG: hypothetical protein LCH85_09860 [Chloroflexi bacterium]|nr:hypothetical protein [Chloroflexota bacterium]
MAFLIGSNPYPTNTTAFTDDVVRIDITDRVKGHDPTNPSVVGKANEQPQTLLQRTIHLLARVVGIETTLNGMDITNLNGLDLLTLKYENTRQAITVAANDTTKAINLANGAIVSLTLNNTSTCALTFSSYRASLSGILVLTANGADRTITLPAAWQPQDVSRTFVIRAGQKRLIAFEVETLSPDAILASGLSEPLLTS